MLLQIQINKFQDRENEKKVDGMNGFLESAYWEELTADTFPVPEPENIFQARESTIT